MRVAKVLKAVLIGVPILLIALIVGAVVALKYTDFNQYKPLIAEAVRKATGRDLTISGDLRLAISLTPGIVVEGVTLSNAQWGSRPDMVSVGRLEAQIALTSLIFGVVEIKRIELTGADILIEIDRLSLSRGRLLGRRVPLRRRSAGPHTRTDLAFLNEPTLRSVNPGR